MPSTGRFVVKNVTQAQCRGAPGRQPAENMCCIDICGKGIVAMAELCGAISMDCIAGCICGTGEV
jgi:hypothetical protein